MVLDETSSQGGERCDMVFTGRGHAEHTRTTVGKPPQRGGCLLGTKHRARTLCLCLLSAARVRIALIGSGGSPFSLLYNGMMKRHAKRRKYHQPP